MLPHQIAKSSEHSHQAALFCWAALSLKTYPELRWLHAIPNGGTRGDDPKSRAIRGAKLKAEGVKAGIPDIFLPVPRQYSTLDGLYWYHGLYIEMKKPGEIKRTSDEQKEFGNYAIEHGYGWVVCDNWEFARDVIIQYLESK